MLYTAGEAFLKGVGLLTVGYYALTLLRSCFAYRAANLKAKYGKFGSWAVVTGASDGIGRALAVELATKGFNVCVIARTKSKLDEVVAEMAAANPHVKGTAIVFDFSTTDDSSYTELLNKLSGLDISIVVNNVGVSLDSPQLFDDYPVQEDIRMVQVNCIAQVRVSKFAVAALRKRGGGAIINLSSYAAVIEQVPFLATYSATKAFNKVLSNSMALELRQFNIDVLTVTPSTVSTAMTQGAASRRPRTSFGMVNAQEMARHTLNSLGRCGETCGHRNHNILKVLQSLLPAVLRDRMMFKFLAAKRKAFIDRKQQTSA